MFKLIGNLIRFILNQGISISHSFKFGKTSSSDTGGNVVKEKYTIDFKIDKTNSLNWEYIVIHHSLTKDGKVADIDGIKKWHMGLSGNSDPYSPDYNPYIEHPMLNIGYHFCIEEVNDILTIEKGRPLSMPGGHANVKGVSDKFNKVGIGICLIGDFDQAEPTYEQYSTLAFLCRLLMESFDIPISKVIGHRDVYGLVGVEKQKSCPGDKFNMSKFKSILA